MTTVLDLLRLPSRPKIALLDWSGVFSRDQGPVHEANSRMLAKRGITAPSFDIWMSQTAASPREAMAAQGILMSPEEIFNEYDVTFGEVCAEGLIPEVYPDALWFFERLRDAGVPAVVISAHPERHLHVEARRYGLFELADGLVGSVPDKSVAIRHYADSMDPDSIVYVGDTVSDVASAKKAGVRAIAVATGYHPHEKLVASEPFVVVKSLRDCAHVMHL
jgi:phosphoglycolate phosphatase